MSELASLPEYKLFIQLLDMVEFYQTFEIDDHSGKEVSFLDVESQHYARIGVLQRIAFKHFNVKLHDFALATVGAFRDGTDLINYLGRLDDEELLDLLSMLKLADKSNTTLTRDMMLNSLMSTYGRRQSQLEALNNISLYPDEKLLWDENLVPFGNYNGDAVLALPKLNLQFLTFHDYLLRSFKLFRLESSYEIREDILDVAKRLKNKKEKIK